MADVLDFGTDGEGLPCADWVDSGDGSISITPYGKKEFLTHVKEGSPIPVPDKSYDIINTRYSMCWNCPRDQWGFIFSEFKRVLRDGGMIVCLESCSTQWDDYNDTVEKLDALIKDAFKKSFPSPEWACILHTTLDVGAFGAGEEDGGEVGLTAYIWRH